MGIECGAQLRNTKAVAGFVRAMIAHVDDFGTEHPVLASFSVGEMTGESIPAPFHPAANQIYKALGLLK